MIKAICYTRWAENYKENEKIILTLNLFVI